MKFRLESVIAVAGIIIVALIALSSSAPKKQLPSVYSTYDTGPNGYRAVYEVLRGAGVPLTRFEQSLDELDPSIRTLVITGYEDDPSAKPLDEHDATLLRHFVESGGRLVAIDAEFAGRSDVAPGVGTTLRNGGGDAIALARNSFTSGVARVSGTIGWIFPFGEPAGTPLLANTQGMVGVSYRVGRGEVVAITAPALFGNAQLRNADNVRFAYNTIWGHGAVAFDEQVHGYSGDPSFWGVLPRAVHAAVWIAVGALILAVIGANVPFAPPYLPATDVARDSSGYISALAELMRRSRARSNDDDVVWRAAMDFQRRKGHA